MSVAHVLDAAASAPPLAGAPFRVRCATQDDIPALMWLKQQMAEADGSVHLLDACADDWARNCLGADPKFHALIVECQSAAVAIATFNEQHFAGWRTPAVYVQDVFVMPEHRRRGIGRALLVRIAEHANGCGARLVYLNVHEANPARLMYAEAGFTQSPSCTVHALVGPQVPALAKSTVAQR